MAAIRGPNSQLLIGTNGGTLTWAVNPAPQGKVIVVLWCASGETISTVIDNGVVPTTFTLDAGPFTSSDGHQISIYRADNITLPASGSYTVTVTGTGGHPICGGGVSYTGVKTGPPTAVNHAGGTSAAPSTGSVTPAANGALYVAGFVDSFGSTDNVNVTAAGFTDWFAQLIGGSAPVGAIADKIDTANPAATTCTWTISSSVVWEGVIVVYDASPYGGPGGTPGFIAGMETTPSDWDGWLGANFGAIARATMFRGVLAGGQSLAANANTILHFDTILEDPLGMWAGNGGGANQPAFSWLAPWTGWYEITVAVIVNPVLIALEPQALMSGTFLYEMTSAGITASLPGGFAGSVIVPMNANLDYVQGQAFAGAAATLVSGVPGQYTSMEISFVST